jgi:hypothetical protein
MRDRRSPVDRMGAIVIEGAEIGDCLVEAATVLDWLLYVGGFGLEGLPAFQRIH